MRSNYSESIADVLKIFQQIGWYIYNPQGKVEYLPIGDDDEYDWQCDEISESELYDIISKKEVNPLFGFDGGGQQYDLIINGKNVGTCTNERIIGQ